MSRMEISFSRYSAGYDDYNKRCGDTLTYFTKLVYDDYVKYGRPGLNSVTLDAWVEKKCYEKFGISPLDAVSLVNQAKSDGYMRWVRCVIRNLVTTDGAKN